MCYHNNNAFKTIQIIFQPGSHFVVQMVGRLIQDQNISRIHENGCKCHAFFLSSGKMCDFLFMVFNTKFIKHHMSLCLGIPALFFLSLYHVRKNGCALWKFRMLRQICDTKAILHNHLSFIGFLETCQYSKKRGLSCSIDTDDSNFVTLMDATGDIVKNHFFAISLADMFQIQYVHLYAPYCKICSSVLGNFLK